MANRMYKPFLGTFDQGVVKLYGSVVTTTSGTVGSTSCKGFSIAKTDSETGRYTVTLQDSYNKLVAVVVSPILATDAAATSAKGLTWYLRNVSVSDTTPTFDIQFCDADGSPADAELQDAAEFLLEITLRNSAI